MVQALNLALSAVDLLDIVQLGAALAGVCGAPRSANASASPIPTNPRARG